MDRLGSSLDRALLLAELHREAGGTVRLAHAELSEAPAKELLPKVRTIPPAAERAPAEQASGEGIDRLLSKYAAEFELDEVELRELAARAATSSAHAGEDVWRRTAERAAELRAALKDLPVPSGEKDEALAGAGRAAAVEALRDHWWVQREDREKGAWVDLDPLLPDAAPGRAIVPATATVPVGAEDGVVALESGLWHEVEVRVVVERWEAGRHAESTALRHALRPADVLGERVRLIHAPAGEVEAGRDPGAAGAGAAERLKRSVIACTEWVPILSVGDRLISESTFRDDGTVHAIAVGPVTEEGGKALGGRVGGLLGRDRDPPKEEKPAAGGARSVLTAEYIAGHFTR